MKHENPQDGELSRIPWHPAFIEAIQLELEDYSNCLEFYPEYQLTSEPLKIDCVIIKKTKDTEIKKNFASIFKKANLLEYKSPGDYISVSGFYKVYGYACLYASFEKIPITELTISFVGSRHPEKLLSHLVHVRRYKVEENNSGIYTVKGDIIPVQIIDNRRLSAEDNIWLKNLSDSLDSSSVIKIKDEAIKWDRTARIQAYMNAIAKANYLVVEEAMEMSEPAKSLEEVLIRTGAMGRAEARAKAAGALEIAQNMVNLGVPFETVVAATKVDPEKVKIMYEK